jgi:hypothetical protein
MSTNTQAQGRTDLTEAGDVATALGTISGEDATRRLRRYEIALARSLQVGNPIYDVTAKTIAIERAVPTIAVPTITGTATTGSTLTAVPGAVTGSPTITYQWKVGGTAVPGATNATFVAQAGAVTVTTTGTNQFGTATATSAATTVT